MVGRAAGSGRNDLSGGNALVCLSIHLALVLLFDISIGFFGCILMSGCGFKVLLADDDRAFVQLLSGWLADAGYQVQAAGDGRRALEMIEADPPDFVITDWMMPYVDGLELCRRVRELTLPHYTYIIMLSARSSPEDMVQGLEVGADDFLAKPLHKGALLARLRSGARMVQLERRLRQLAHTDALTGLMTQRTFYELLEKAWQAPCVIACRCRA